MVITFITLLLIRVAEENALLIFSVQLPPLLLRHMHIVNVVEHPQVSKIWFRPEV